MHKGGKSLFEACFKAFLLLLSFTLGNTLYAQTSCNYKYSRLIRIDHTKVTGGADLQNFPVYLTTVGLGDESLFKSAGNGGHVQSANGYDIMFTAADGVTPLDFQMENYVATTGEYEAWVNIPYVSHTTDTYFYMYYGDAAIVADQSTTSTWDANTVGVWHLDNASFTTDATGNGNTAVNNGSTNNAAAEILSGRTLAGNITNSQYIQLGLTGASANAGTVDLWGKITTYGNSTYFFGESSTQNATYTNRIQLYQNSTTGQLELGMGSNHTQANVMTLSLNTWYHIVATWSTTGGGNGTYFVYVNGVQKSTGSYSGFSSIYTTGDAGNDGNAGQRTEAMTGSLDEIHFSKVARSGGWVGTEYNDESSPATFCLIGAEPAVWTGATSSNWATATNWSTGVVPAAGANVIISSAGTQPSLSANETVGYIWVQSGATVTLQAGVTLSVDYSTINCGTITSAGTGVLTYVATAATSPINQYISGNGTYSLGLLTSNPSTLTDTVFLGSTVTASSNFTNSQGVFDCEANTLNVAGNFTDNSVFLPVTGTVTLNGTTGTQTVSSTEAGGLNFYNLILNNTSGTAPAAITTSCNTNVQNQLTFKSTNTGEVNLNANTMTLGTAVATPGTLVYPVVVSGWLYGGTFKRWFGTTAVTIPNNTGLFPVGSNGTQADYQPLWFGSSANLTTGGTISVFHSPTTSWHTLVAFTDASWTPPVTGTPIQAISIAAWQVTTGGGLALSGSNGQIRFGGYGFNIFILADLDACQSAGAIGTYAASTSATVPLEVNRTGLNLANVNNTWYIGTSNVNASPLPIQLKSFTATCQNGYPVLQWTTSTETNNDHFTIDKTQDGVHYELVADVKGAGNSTSEKNYAIVDYSAVTGITYYRLSQTDFDGTTTNLQTIVYVPCVNLESINAYGSGNSINIQINSDSLANYNITVTNVLGQIILNENKQIVPGLNIFKVYPQTSTDVYILRITGNNHIYTKKILLMPNQ